MKTEKYIHYCWFGGNPLPKDAVRCIESWKKYLPDYKIIEWNEKNFDLATSCTYVRQAYECKKWAFVSDYARFKILYEYGGLYFDTDVEVIKNLDDIIKNGNFMAEEMNCFSSQTKGDIFRVAPGLGLYAVPGLSIYRRILDVYESSTFLNEKGEFNGKTVVDYTTELLQRYGYKGDGSIEHVEEINIYPPEYFCPMNPVTGEINITDNTFSIHHYTASWQSPYTRFKTAVKRVLGKKVSDKIIYMKRKMKNGK